MSKKNKNKDSKESDLKMGWHSYALILDKKSTIKFITKPLAALLGFTVSELLGKNAIQLLVEKSEWDDRISQLDFLYKQESVINAFDARLTNKNGDIISLRFGILKLSSSNNEIEDIALIGDDLSATKKVVQSIVSPESQLAQLVDSAKEFIIIIDGFEEIKSINQIGTSQLGIKAGMSLRELLEPVAIKRTTNFLESLKKINSTANINLVLLHPKSKQRFYLDGTVSSVVVDSELKEFRLILHDITEQIKTE